MAFVSSYCYFSLIYILIMNEGYELKHTIEVLFYDSQTTDNGILYAVLLCSIVLVQCFYSVSFKDGVLHINCSVIQVVFVQSFVFDHYCRVLREVKVKSSMAKSLPVENLLPQNVGSIINYLQ